jgi:hypothetical protein
MRDCTRTSVHTDHRLNDLKQEDSKICQTVISGDLTTVQRAVHKS